MKIQKQCSLILSFLLFSLSSFADGVYVTVEKDFDEDKRQVIFKITNHEGNPVECFWIFVSGYFADKDGRISSMTDFHVSVPIVNANSTKEVDAGYDFISSVYDKGGSFQGFIPETFKIECDYKFYQFRSKDRDKCMQTTGSVYESDCNNSDNQKWALLKVDDQYYKIMNKQNRKCLDANRTNSPDNPFGPYGNIYTFDCHGGDNQLWKMEEVGDAYKLSSKDRDYCVDANRTDNVHLHPYGPYGNIYECSFWGGLNQLWIKQ